MNPIAGMGGAVGLKGTDGLKTLRKAVKRGAKPVAPERGREFLLRFKSNRRDINLLTAPGQMGSQLAKSLGLNHVEIGRVAKKTTGKDTTRLSSLMEKRGVDLLVFCGGDGTAKDVFNGAGDAQPVLGVAAGVKVYSSVFAVNPALAAETATDFLNKRLPTRQGEVLDIDEKLYRENQLSVKSIGYLTTPDSEFAIQGSKSATRASEADELESVAKFVKEEMEPTTVYVLGPGTTVAKIGERLGVRKTLLGVDVVKGDGTVLGLDVDEARLLQLVEKSPVKVVVSPIGGQGFLFGRGNQQISPRVLRKVGVRNLIVAASKTKIASLSPRRLLVDTGDSNLDEELKGFRRVVTGYMEEMIVKVE